MTPSIGSGGSGGGASYYNHSNGGALGAGGAPSNYSHQDVLGTGSAPSFYSSEEEKIPSVSSHQVDLYTPQPEASLPTEVHAPLSFGIWGCSPTMPIAPQSKPAAPPAPPAAPKKDPLKIWPEDLPGIDLSSQKHMKVRVEYPGGGVDHPEHGRILFLRQIHHAPLIVTDGRVEGILTDFQSFAETAKYQLEMLRLLESLKPKPQIIFLEGTFGESSDSEETINPHQFNPKKVRKVFRGALPEQRSLSALVPEVFEGTDVGVKMVLLGMAGAPFVYAVRNRERGVMLSLTSDEKMREEFRAKYSRLIEEWSINGGEPDPDLVWWLKVRREEVATKKMISMLELLPKENKNIVLVYGAAHQFFDNFIQQQYYPRIISVTWELPDTPLINQEMEKIDEIRSKENLFNSACIDSPQIYLVQLAPSLKGD